MNEMKMKTENRRESCVMEIRNVSYSSSSFISEGQLFQPSRRTSGGLEWEVESTIVTHSSADWWDLLLPLA